MIAGAMAQKVTCLFDLRMRTKFFFRRSLAS